MDVGGADTSGYPEVVSDLSKKDEADQPFYFESDHVALKGNSDYQMLLRTTVLLEAQRTKAVRDLDKLHDLKDSALKDPLRFVEKLQNRVDQGIPQPQTIAKLPSIEWEKYATSLEQSAFRKHGTRGKHLDVNPLLRKKQSAASAALAVASAEGAIVVRGRLKDGGKPETFNQLWTWEEQRRLEELLVEYPPEEVEARRFQKIADALGNRTYHQVASRIQKYFIKLAKAGRPVPGRIPNLTNYHSKNKGPRRHHRYNYLYSSSASTMLQAYTPPVYMPDQDDDDDGSFSLASASLSTLSGDNHKSQSPAVLYTQGDGDSTTNYLDEIPADLHNTDEYMELVYLQKLKKQALHRHSATTWQEPDDKQCYCCNARVIPPAAFQCVTCGEDEKDEVYICASCNRGHVSAGRHIGSHTIVQLEREEDSFPSGGSMTGTTFVDPDYVASNFNIPGCNNYLDPNYMPAT